MQVPARTTLIRVSPSPQSLAVTHHTECPITDSQLDSYKYGAFLEKADRFTEAKPSDVPGEPQCSCYVPSHIPSYVLIGPSSYPQTDHGPANKPSAKRIVHATNERYATLQRQLEELERIHAESRKTVCGPMKGSSFCTS
jgi:hypothetical protein